MTFHPAIPPFDTPVPHNGYRWWYMDGASEDGQHHFVVIIFIGSVFSPYYFHARKKSPANPFDFCAINVALYGKKKHWAMTERGARHTDFQSHQAIIGPSSAKRTATGLTVTVDETTVPWFRALRGVIEVELNQTHQTTHNLDGHGHHYWMPIDPLANVSVNFEKPKLAWRGQGYMDTNFGDRPLERDFVYWDWSRKATRDDAAIRYRAITRDGSENNLSLAFTASGDTQAEAIHTPNAIGKTGWGIHRQCQEPGQLQLIKTLEDTPFYARSALNTSSHGSTASVVHETLDLDRFKSTWVRTLLPFRMPRIR